MDHSKHQSRFAAFLAAVPTTVERKHIEDVVDRYMSTYATKDIETRLSLFAETLSFEDPIGHHLASTSDELRTFFEATLATGVSLRFFPGRRVVVGDEALQVAKLLIEHEDGDIRLLELYMTVGFNPAGLITQVRVYYDANCEQLPL
ncbi:MAG: nuclear transport factor 2 family protein [Mycobacteriales bacterium]